MVDEKVTYLRRGKLTDDQQAKALALCDALWSVIMVRRMTRSTADDYDIALSAVLNLFGRLIMHYDDPEALAAKVTETLREAVATNLRDRQAH